MLHVAKETTCSKTTWETAPFRSWLQVGVESLFFGLSRLPTGVGVYLKNPKKPSPINTPPPVDTGSGLLQVKNPPSGWASIVKPVTEAQGDHKITNAFFEVVFVKFSSRSVLGLRMRSSFFPSSLESFWASDGLTGSSFWRKTSQKTFRFFFFWN